MEKLYKVQMNSNGMPNFSTAVEVADRPQEWISCSERLPSEKDYIGDVVIWCTDKSIVGVGWYYESTKSWATIDDTFPPILGEVIAWMPLPKPWRGADESQTCDNCRHNGEKHAYDYACDKCTDMDKFQYDDEKGADDE